MEHPTAVRARALATIAKPSPREVPEDFGYRNRRCPKCDCWISRYSPEEFCRPCSGNGHRILVQTATGWVTLKLVRRRKETRAELIEVMEQR
jgi:hypothetical protein